MTGDRWLQKRCEEDVQAFQDGKPPVDDRADRAWVLVLLLLATAIAFGTGFIIGYAAGTAYRVVTG